MSWWLRSLPEVPASVVLIRGVNRRAGEAELISAARG